MSKSDTRFLYTDDDGNLCIVIPADNCDLTLDQIKSNYGIWYKYSKSQRDS
jgi:hypothetical protein